MNLQVCSPLISLSFDSVGVTVVTHQTLLNILFDRCVCAAKMTKKWTAAMTIKFLEGYENHTCLWDVHSEAYKNRDDRESAYKNLSQLMDIHGFDTAAVKAKIRSIRNSYALEIAKIKKSRHSGAGAEEVYKPKVAWFPIAHRILHEVVQIRETQSSGLETETQFEPDDSVEDTQPPAAVNEVLPPSTSNSSGPIQATPRRLTAKAAAPKRAIARTRKGSTEKALEALQGIARTLEEPPTKEDGGFDCFGKSVACQLKKLPESEALRTMAYIQSYLVQQRLKSNLEKRPPQSSSVASPASSSNYEYATTPDASSSYVGYHYSSSANSYHEEEPSTDILSQAISTVLDNSNDTNY